MRTLLIATIAAFVLVVPSRSSAAPIGYAFTGTVTSIDAVLPSYLPGIEVGMTLEGAIYFETDPSLAFFNHFDAYLGSYHFSSGAGFTGGVTGDNGLFSWSGLFALNVDGPYVPAAGYSPADFVTLSFDLADTTSPVGSFHLQGLDILCFPCADDTPGFDVSLTSVALVPDAGSGFGLLALGLSALAVLRRRGIAA